MFQRKKPSTAKEDFDRAQYKPVIRSSICTGEQVAGFKSLKTGKFEEVMPIRGRRDLELFLGTYGIDGDEVTKEW